MPASNEKKRGKVAVGRILIQKGMRIQPHPPKNGEDWHTVVAMTPSSKDGDISPYVLANEEGRLIENVWQFSKVYRTVQDHKEHYSQWDRRIIWEQKAAVHVDENNELTEDYWRWRERGMRNKFPVRYPIGFRMQKKPGSCLFSVKSREDPRRLSYIDARKEIYVPEFKKALLRTKKFQTLRQKHENGENIFIVEIDGPHVESMPYYKKKYSVDDDFIVDNVVMATKENLDVLLNDDLHSYGHGYCIADAIQE